MFIEGACEVALEQLVVVDGLGDDPAHELEVAEVVGVTVGGGVDGVSDAVARRRAEQRVHRVEDLLGDDQVPLSQQTSRILALFT